MTPTRHLLLLACTFWSVALLTVSPDARERQRAREKMPHPDLSLFSHSENCVACHMQTAEPPQAHFKFTDHYIRVIRSGESYPD